MSYQPQLIDLDEHHRYNDYKENRYPSHRNLGFIGSNRASVYQKVDLDQFSSDDEGVAQVPPGGIIYDDLTTTSGSDFVPSEAYHRFSRKCLGRERNLGSSFPSMSTIHTFAKFIDSSEDDDDDSLTKKTPQRLNGLSLVSPLTPFTNSYRRRTRNLEMIEEISPVLPTDKRNESDELPPQLKPIHLSKAWNPMQTSTRTSMVPPPQSVSKPNSRHVGITSTPRNSTQMGFNTRYYGIDDIYDPAFYKQQQQRQAKVFAKSDHFGLPSQVAEKHESRGIMNLTIKIRRMTVVVYIHKATYFLDPSRPITSFVKVELKPSPKKISDPKKRKRSAREAHRYFDSFKTDSIPRTNCPLFSETFKLKISEANIRANDVISISVFSRVQAGRNNEAERELLGCMAFPLFNLFKKADLIHEHRGGHIEISDDYVPVCRGGYFLLGKMYGSKNHLSESSIRHSKYYDAIGGNSISTCSSSGIASPIKARMMGEYDWRVTPHNSREAVLTRIGVSSLKDGANNRSGPISLDYVPPASQASKQNSNCYYGSSSGSNGYPGPKKRTSLTNALINGSDSPCTSSSSSTDPMANNARFEYSTSNSSYSTNNSGHDFTVRDATVKHPTMPSVLTTNDNEFQRSTDCQRGQLVNLDLLYAERPMTYQPRHLGSVDKSETTHECDDVNDSKTNDVVDPVRVRFDSIGARELHNDALMVVATSGHSGVRRVASFSSPPTKNQVAKASQQKERDPRRGFFGKTLKFFRNKGTMSSHVVYPSIEEAKAWAEKMETLLESKTGVLFFAQFLDNEYSRENLDFSLKCREYKKLFRNPKKNQKKIGRLAKNIYDQFLDDCAPQEVNLEASVRTATRAALNADLREDTFSLAQTKIEQLLANDKYQRFLKSDIYQDLINRLNAGSAISVHSVHPELPLSSSEGESTPCATANEETPLAPNQGNRKALRPVSVVNRIEE